LSISLSSWFYSLFGNLICVISWVEDLHPIPKSKAGIFRLSLPEIPALLLSLES